jgi:hypothetical protein
MKREAFMLTKRVRRVFAAVALVPLLITACEGNNPFDPFDEATGTYVLTIFADNSMPAIFECAPGQCEEIPNGGTIRVNNGTLTLRDDGSFTEVNNFTFTENGFGSRDEPFVSTGTFSLNGQNLTLDGDDGRFVTGTLRSVGGDVRINYDEEGFSYEYVKD